MEPYFSGQSHDNINKQVQFLMMEQKRNNNNNLFDIDASMKTDNKVMVTHMGVSKGIKRVGERAIAAIFKE